MRIMFRLVFFVIRLQFHLMNVKHLSHEPGHPQYLSTRRLLHISLQTLFRHRTNTGHALFHDTLLNNCNLLICFVVDELCYTSVHTSIEPTRSTHCFTILFSTIATSLYVSNLVVLTSLTKYSNPSLLPYRFKLTCILIIDKRLFICSSDHLYLFMCLFHSYTQKFLYILPTLSPPIFLRGGGVSRDSILPPSVCACQHLRCLQHKRHYTMLHIYLHYT